MKFGRLAGILTVAVLSASLCACGQKGQTNEADKAATSELFEKIGSETQNSTDTQNETDTEVLVSEQDAAETDTSTVEVEVAEEVQNEETQNEAPSDNPEGDQTSESETQPETALEQPLEAENQQSDAQAVVTADENPTPTVSVTATYDMQTLQNMHYSDEQMEQIRQYYSGSVFAGDSVLLGFRNYASRSTDPMLSQMQFLAAGSLSLHNAFWPVSDKSVHPLYQGAQHPIWESMQMMGANKAFLFFGINDVSYNIDESVALYPQLVDKIREFSPNMEINIISATYTLKDMGKGKLNNTNIAAFNQGVRALAEQNGWGYIDMATVLSDGAGNLLPEYCSDGFLHESKAAYNVWTQMLIRYAAERLGLQETPAEAIAQETPENNG